MPKKVFDPNKMKNGGSSNNAISNFELVIWYSNRELKVSFDIKNLIFGNFPNAKEDFWP